MKLLVPLDGSELSNAILPTVRGLVGLVPGLEVHVIGVLDPSHVRDRADHDVREPASQASGIPTTASVESLVASEPGQRSVEDRGHALARVEQTEMERLEALAKTQLAGIPAQCHVEWEKHAAEGILRQAKAIGVDAIAMVSHGRSGLSHLLAGSVTEEVLRKSPQPVLVLGPNAHAPVGEAVVT